MSRLQDGVVRLPGDFDAKRYAELHADLSHLSSEAASEHYLAFGRVEGRRYREHHVDGFDPDHFRETHPGFAAEPDDICRDAWVHAGGHDGEPGRQGIHLARLELDLDRFPAAFPWRAYTRLVPRAAMHRWSALAHFLEEGFGAYASALPYGADAAAFLCAVGDRFARRDDVQALKAYALAAATGPLDRAARIAMAEIHARFGAWVMALETYRALVTEGEYGRPVLDGLVRVTAEIGAWEVTLPLLQTVHDLPDSVASDAAEAYFAREVRFARACYLDGRRSEGDALLAAATRRLFSFLDRPAPLPQVRSTPASTVIMLVADGLPEAARQRAGARTALFVEAGYDLQVMSPGEIDRIPPLLAGTSALILFRMPGWPSLVRLVLAARRAGVPTLYETDELTFDPDHAPPPFATFDGMISRRLYEDLLFGVALYRGAASLCDYGVAPNTTLAERLGALVRQGRAFVVRDTVALAQPVAELDRFPHVVLHATRAFELGPDSAAGRALLDAMEGHRDLRLTTIGHVRLSEAFGAVASRTRQLGPGSEADGVLAYADLNLVIAGSGAAEGCVAIRGWLDAARHGVATLASATDAYRAALEHGEDVWLADTAAEWRDGLETLLQDDERRAAMGAAARMKSGAQYASSSAVADVIALLEAVRAAQPGARPPAPASVRTMTEPSLLMRLRRLLARRLDPDGAERSSSAREAPPIVVAPVPLVGTPPDTVDNLFERLVSGALAGANTLALDGSYVREIGPLVDGDSLEARSAEHLLATAARPGAALLDFGCGGMHHRAFIESLGYAWRGVDYLEGVSTTVRDDVAHLGDMVAFYDGITLPFPDASFDVVWSMLVFQHIQSIDASFAEIARVLKPGGRLIGQVAYLEQMQDFGTFNYTPYGLKVAARNAGLRLKRVDPKHDVFSFLIRRLIITFTASDETPLNRMMGPEGFYHAKIIETGQRLGLDTRMINLLRLLFCTHFVFVIEKPADATP